jgi:hypothetical protein
MSPRDFSKKPGFTSWCDRRSIEKVQQFDRSRRLADRPVWELPLHRQQLKLIKLARSTAWVFQQVCHREAYLTAGKRNRKNSQLSLDAVQNGKAQVDRYRRKDMT